MLTLELCILHNLNFAKVFTINICYLLIHNKLPKYRAVPPMGPLHMEPNE